LGLRRSNESARDFNPVPLCHVTLYPNQEFPVLLCVDIQMVLLQLAAVMNWARSRLRDVMLRLGSASAERDTLGEHVTAAR
jgi:hypothetical protein